MVVEIRYNLRRATPVLEAAPAARTAAESAIDCDWICATARHVLASELQARIEAGANPHSVNWAGEDALMLAARHGGSIEVIKFLMGHCSPLARSNNGSTALQMSMCRHGGACGTGVFELLAEHSDLSIKGNGESILHAAARNGLIHECQKLMAWEPSLSSALDDDGSTAMMIALDAKHWQCALILLPQSNPDVPRFSDQKTALMIALEVASALDVRREAWVEVAQALVCSCDPRKEDSLGRKSIEFASRVAHRLPGAIELLGLRETVLNDQDAIEAALAGNKPLGRKAVARL